MRVLKRLMVVAAALALLAPGLAAAQSASEGAVRGYVRDEQGAATIRMTLTSPMCPAAEELPPEVESKARGVEGVTAVTLDLVWEPPWSPALMSEAAKLELGML